MTGTGDDGVGTGPSDLGVRGWFAAVRRLARETKDDNLTDFAAALTYYAMLSIFPLLLAVLSVLGLIGQTATEPLPDNLRQLAPGPARDTVATAIGRRHFARRAVTRQQRPAAGIGH